MIVVGEILGPGCPLGNPHLSKLREDEFPQVASGDYVGEEKSDHFAPDDVLLADAEIPGTQTVIKLFCA